MVVTLYNESLKNNWDDFVENSKNGTFMLKRDYMDYHSDRFKDCSLLFYEDDKLIAILPASLHGTELRSHGGLTYGGIVSNKRMTTQKMLDVFDVLRDSLRKNGVNSLIYKRIPSVYHLYPSDEDLYALFRNGAKLVRRDISTAVLLEDKIKFSDLRKRGAKKALKRGLTVKESNDFDTYVDLLTKVLEEHHGTKPVHTAEELKLLAGRFPDIIKLFAAYDGQGKMYAGSVIFDTKQTVHAQYIANSDEGRAIGALDLVFDYLINEYCFSFTRGGQNEKAFPKKYFDFGISTEDDGKYLNNGLISQKEGFGGRGIAYDFYEMMI